MPLVPDAIYAIRNDLTHTVLDFTGNENQNFVLGWGWHGGYNQKWKLIRVGDPNDNNWQLQNQLLRANQRRFLSRQANAAHRLVGEVANANATFVIERIAGPSERYRILHDGQAVTLITGGGAEAAAHNILPAHQVLDLHADGPPIALQARDNANRAQIWSFLPIAQLPVENGIYRIVNETGLVLDLTAGNDAGLVQGLESQQTVGP
ncbi:hypothetical protein BYT27DRAFT_7193684 [Phlegmacium glaucopus]|nr:hypothetical protein BYT27DRAFT_7193684 [Phlegmacium glaucopus]